ncbi:MAG: hypothetical protein Fur0010_24280 [Bdellovibrio sp.]
MWQGLVFWAIVYTAAEAPYTMVYHTKIHLWQVVIDVCIAAIFLVDFRTHYKRLKSIIQKEKKKGIVEKHNFEKITLVVDLIACIPFDLIAFMFDSPNVQQVLSLIRLLRLVRVMKILDMFGDLVFVPRFIKMQMIVVWSLMAIHWVTLGWIFIYPSAPGEDVVEYYIKSFYWAVTTLTTIGYGDITPNNTVGRIYTMIIQIAGVGVYGIVIGNVSRIFAENARIKEQTRDKISQLNLFMKHYQIPGRLQDAVFGYYNHIFAKRLSDNDQQIISELPHALQKELQMYMNVKLIRNLTIFKHCSFNCLREVALSLEEKFYAPGQAIINIGDHGEEMFIIGHGSVEVTLADGKVVATLSEGNFFGEIALLQETTRNANVRSTAYCDLFLLKKIRFSSNY